MTEIAEDLVRRLVTRRKADGRCVYDPQAKAEVVQACLNPGVSVARIGMQCGVNANLLRRWIVERHGVGGDRRGSALTERDASATFVPLRIGTNLARPLAPQPATFKLQARLPNGVEINLAETGMDEMSALMQILGTLSCSGSTTR